MIDSLGNVRTHSVELLAYCKEWYALCERRNCVDKITISGGLAEAFVDALDLLDPKDGE